MRRHGMKGVVFLVPGRMRSAAGPAAPPSTTSRPGACRPRSCSAARRARAPSCPGRRSRPSPRPGLFDFQSHTLTHARIHVAPRLAGFVDPGATKRATRPSTCRSIAADGRDLLGRRSAARHAPPRARPRASRTRCASSRSPSLRARLRRPPWPRAAARRSSQSRDWESAPAAPGRAAARPRALRRRRRSATAADRARARGIPAPDRGADGPAR